MNPTHLSRDNFSEYQVYLCGISEAQVSSHDDRARFTFAHVLADLARFTPSS